MFSSVVILAAGTKVMDVTEYRVVTEHVMPLYDGIENLIENVTTDTMYVDTVFGQSMQPGHKGELDVNTFY